jgi:hypothetical protein
VTVGTWDVQVTVGTLDLQVTVGTWDVQVTVGTWDVQVTVVTVFHTTHVCNINNWTQLLPAYWSIHNGERIIAATLTLQ